MQCTTEASAQHRLRLRGESFSDNTSINNNNNDNDSNDDKFRIQATVADSHDAPDGTANT